MTAVSFASFINEAMQELKYIIESLLFVSEEPLTVDKIKGIIESSDNKEIRNALRELSDEYTSRAGGFYLSEVAGGYQLRSRPVYHDYIKRLLQPSPQRLSRAALETLAVVAYRQPVIRADIEHIRGVDCGSMLRQLMERKLLRVLGRKEIPGRPLIYATTKTFLELFELKDLSELPTPAEIEQMGAVFNPDPEEDGSPETNDPAPLENESPPGAEGETAPDNDSALGADTAEPNTVTISEEVTADKGPTTHNPGDPTTIPAAMMETAEPQTDEQKSAAHQPDRNDRPPSQQEITPDDPV